MMDSRSRPQGPTHSVDPNENRSGMSRFPCFRSSYKYRRKPSICFEHFPCPCRIRRPRAGEPAEGVCNAQLFSYLGERVYTAAELAAVAESEKSLHDIDHAVFGIQHRQAAPFVKHQAGMRNIEGQHVANADVISVADLHECVLV